MYEISCNSCETSLQGNCYRTKCQHLLCESCACKSFNQGSLCIICGLKLHEGEVIETIIGINPLPLQDLIFQTIFQTTSWIEILENSLKVLLSGIEASLFIQNQLLYESSKKSELYKELNNKIEKFKEEKNKLNLQMKNEATIAQQRIRELEHHIQMREKELYDIKEAYNEKTKKCDSWENAYESLRKQYESEKSITWKNNYDKNTDKPTTIIPDKLTHFNQQLNSFTLNQSQNQFRSQSQHEKTTYHHSDPIINIPSNIFNNNKISSNSSSINSTITKNLIPLNSLHSTSSYYSSSVSSKRNSPIMKQNISPFFDNFKIKQQNSGFFDKKS